MPHISWVRVLQRCRSGSPISGILEGGEQIQRLVEAKVNLFRWIESRSRCHAADTLLPSEVPGQTEWRSIRFAIRTSTAGWDSFRPSWPRRSPHFWTTSQSTVGERHFRTYAIGSRSAGTFRT